MNNITAFQAPDKQKITQYNILATISDDMNKGYQDLKLAIAWWGNKKENSQTGSEFIIGHQLTSEAEQRNKDQIEKRTPMIKN